METIFKIAIFLLAVLIFVLGIWLWLDILGFLPKQKNVEELVSLEPQEPELEKEKETVYGIEMSITCSRQLKDFIEKYGQDYSQCFKSFEFDKNYCGRGDMGQEELANVNVVIILDSSGSMAAKLGNSTRIDVAKKAVSDFLLNLPNGVNTGLIVYGHKGSNSLSDKEASCLGVEEVIKLGRNDYQKILSALKTFNPKGWTPLADSIQFAKNILKEKGRNNKNYLILVSDGIESCDKDPVKSAEDLKLELPELNFVVIGFMTDSETQQFLEKITKYGGGTYLRADNATKIAYAFKKQLWLIKKDCLSISLLRLSLDYDANNLKNTECWLLNTKKEWDSFQQNVSEKAFHSKCKYIIGDALKARQKEFWYEKQLLEEKNSQILSDYKKEINTQLKELESQKIY